VRCEALLCLWHLFWLRKRCEACCSCLLPTTMGTSLLIRCSLPDTELLHKLCVQCLVQELPHMCTCVVSALPLNVPGHSSCSTPNVCCLLLSVCAAHLCWPRLSGSFHLPITPPKCYVPDPGAAAHVCCCCIASECGCCTLHHTECVLGRLTNVCVCSACCTG
jgi:hypothetical protein